MKKSNLPEARVGRTSVVPFWKGFARAVVIAAAPAILLSLVFLIPSCKERNNLMTKGEASARASLMLGEPMKDCWGDTLGWQCQGISERWVSCVHGDCYKLQTYTVDFRR